MNPSSPAVLIFEELDRHNLTGPERMYAVGTVHRFLGYATAWIDVDQPGIRPLATVAAIAAAVKGLEVVTRASDPCHALRALLEALPET